MPETAIAEKAIVRAVTLKGTQEPPIGEFYYGEDITLPSGDVLKTVWKRPQKIMSGGSSALAKTSITMWYEKPVVAPSGESRMLIFHVVSAPGKVDNIFPDCLYPVCQFNVSPERRDIIEWIPDWQLRDYIDPKQPQVESPIIVRHAVSGMLGTLRCFHFVVLNDRYTPNRTADGMSDDGNWEYRPPVLGQWIIDYFNTRKARGRNPTQYAQG